MKNTWLIALVIILSFLLIGVGAYYLGVTNTQRQMTSAVTQTSVKTVTTTYRVPVGTGLSAATYKDGFLFQVYLDKFAYRQGEPIAIYFNITNIGNATRIVYFTENNTPFRISVHNATQELAQGIVLLASESVPYSFGAGKSFTGRAVISGKEYSIGPQQWGGFGSFGDFTPDNTYSVEGSVTFSLDINRINVNVITAPPLQILITQK